MIFVFGSNLAGRHGAGAAKAARLQHGAIIGSGFGLQGSSYAIPTKDHNLKPLPLVTIKTFVDSFLQFAKERQDMNFLVTRIGCGLAGYNDGQIAPMFAEAPSNCFLSMVWTRTLHDYWKYTSYKP